MDDTVVKLLMQLQKDQAEGHADLAEKIETGFANVATIAANHELEDTKRFSDLDKRLIPVENTRRTILWLGATVFTGAVAAAWDFIVNHHLPRHP